MNSGYLPSFQCGFQDKFLFSGDGLVTADGIESLPPSF